MGAPRPTTEPTHPGGDPGDAQELLAEVGRCVIKPRRPPATGFTGVGVATYTYVTYVAPTTADVRAAIDTYERGVRLLVDPKRGSPDR